MESSGEFCLSLGECYETIIQTMAEGVFVVDSEGNIVFANQAMEQLTGFPVEELVGKRCHTFMQCRCNTRDCLLASSENLTRKECRVKHKMGQFIPVFRNARVKLDDSGNVMGIIETITDITELKAVQQRVTVLEKKDQARNRFRNMIGKSRSMKEVFNLIQLAADSNASILITGETGTGKELVAELIHKEGKRKRKSLVKVNCSALAENLLESELFGHVKGAFTGALQDKTGRFEAADKGTLFLDEISEVSPLIQLKILRFLQEREFERVGEHQTRKADVRIISASNKDLRALIQEGIFREDLFYRLKVFPINIPPLRERKEDIALLVEHFIDKFKLETGKEIQGLNPDAASAILEHDWPGNVRELENAIEHAFVICREGEIQLKELPQEVRAPTPQSNPGMRSDHPPVRPVPTLSQSRKNSSIPIDELLQLLELYHWNKAAVARHLNINRTTVWRLLKKHGLA
jgi:two-component system, NtrC family, response regulator HydG